MNNTILMTGIGGLIAGFLLGNVAGRNAAPDPADYTAPMQEQIAALNERLDGLESGLSDRVNALQDGVSARFDAIDSAVSEQTAAAAEGARALRDDLAAMGESVGAGTEALRQDLAAMGDTVSSAVSDAASSARAAVETAVGTATEAVTGSDDTQTGDSEADASSGDAAPAPAETAAANAEGAAAGTRAGMTASLADGALRVFVSRVLAEDGRASVAVNGLDLMTMGAGYATEVTGLGEEACLLRLDAVTEGGADFSASCGDARPEPEGATAGETAALGDGLRVFVSRASDGIARIAVNGQDTVSLATGESTGVPGQRCAVTVEGVDRGHVSLSSDC